MDKETKRDTSFIIEVKQTQNYTWQGNLTWVEQQKNTPFRSTLELIKLMDSAIASSEMDNNTAKTEE